jgi:hypothetical protein
MLRAYVCERLLWCVIVRLLVLVVAMTVYDTCVT